MPRRPGLRRQHAQPVVRQVRRRERGDLGMVEGRRHLDDVHARRGRARRARAPAPAPASSRARPAPASRSPARRRGRARRCRRRDRPAPSPARAADHLQRRGDRRCGAARARSGSRAPRSLVVEGADPHLRRAAGVHHPLADRPAHHRAVVDPPRIVRPEIAVRVHLDQRQRPVLRRMRPEQRPGDEMVAAERQQLRARARSPPPPPPRSPAPPSRDGAGRAWRRRGRPPRATSAGRTPRGTP